MSFLGFKKFEKEKQNQIFNDLYTLDQTSLKNKGPQMCNSLPLIEYYNVEEDPGSTYVDNPREICLRLYTKRTLDVSACKILKNLPDSDDIGCFLYVAEGMSDPSLCDGLENNNWKIQCIAQVTLDAKKCYEMEKEKSDSIGKYPAEVMDCLAEVAWRTEDHRPCLDIASSDYGLGWKYGRNRCLINAMALTASGLAQKKEFDLCDAMVDTEEGPFNDKTRCLEFKSTMMGKYSRPYPLSANAPNLDPSWRY